MRGHGVLPPRARFPLYWLRGSSADLSGHSPSQPIQKGPRIPSGQSQPTRPQRQSHLKMSILKTLALSSLASILCAGLASARAPDPDQQAFFETKIRPVLVEKCYRCHSAEAANQGKLKAGLLLDTPRRHASRWRQWAGCSFQARSTRALLIEALRYEFLMMPPEGKLPDPVIADFEAWIEQRRTDPRVESRRPRSHCRHRYRRWSRPLGLSAAQGHAPSHRRRHLLAH